MTLKQGSFFYFVSNSAESLKKKWIQDNHIEVLIRLEN
jgi:hypothetical protein